MELLLKDARMLRVAYRYDFCCYW